MKTLFESGSLSPASNAPMLMEVGTEYCLLSKLDDRTGQPLFARLWTFKETQLNASLEKVGALVNEVPGQAQTLIGALAFPETYILPNGSNHHKQMLGAVFPGNHGSQRFYNNGYTFAFAVPPSIENILGQHFSSVSFIPVQACMPEMGAENNSIHVFFVDHQIRVVVYKNHTLQLVQQYSFQAPLDVVYYLLKICTEFGLSQQETLISVSGYIEPASVLYKELHQYFLNIRFSHLESVSIDGQSVPKHYFSSLYNLAQCAL